MKIIDPKKLPIEIDFYLKLRILEEQSLVEQLPGFEAYVGSIDEWHLDKFVESHSKEQVEYAIRILKEELKSKWDVVTQKIFDAASKYYGKLSDEQLLFYPYFLRVCNEKLPQNMVQKLIDLIINKYASTGQGLLVQESLEAGVEILKLWGDQLHKQLLPILEKYMDEKNKQESKAICAVIYLGILAPYLKNSSDIQSKLLNLFQVSKQPT